MSADNKMKPSAVEEQEKRRSNSAPSPQDSDATIHTRAQVDEEIAAMEERSRHQQASIQAPPELPPAPPERL